MSTETHTNIKKPNKLKEAKTIGIETDHFVRINTNLLLKRTHDKIQDKDFSQILIQNPLNLRIKNLILSLYALQTTHDKNNSKL